MLAVSVETMTFDYGTAPHRIIFEFSGYVEPSLDHADLHLENLTTAQTVNSDLVSYNTNDVATFTAPQYTSGILPNGNYQSTIFADAVIGPDGLPMSDDADFEFFFLKGDVAGPSGGPRDRLVGLHDYNRMVANWGATGASYDQGDFNYDGNVNLQDWNFLAANFGATLAETPAPGTLEISQGPGQNTLNWNFADWQLPADIEGFRIQRSLDGQVFEIYHDLEDPAARQWVDDAFGLGLATRNAHLVPRTRLRRRPGRHQLHPQKSRQHRHASAGESLRFAALND